ncbi:MAG: hypothetical protein COV47_03905 [Candidatus Diapherotrites archaeon CG11_big_fil_rev_8_21_14_0_20_37_9]|nr:MAG: hypothetical protein COV47_03905 [Candidatus Diapherotrites archaeon CG11_big_fil_rev_8_21_14_0_20_37_9]
MKLLKVLAQPKYAALAGVSAAIMVAVYIYTQVLGNAHNISVWFAAIPLENLGFFIVFTALFGITFSFQVYNWLQSKTCTTNQKAGAAGSSGIGTAGLFLVAQCPACASLGALFLPLSAITFITEFSWLINLAGIGLLIFTINYLGGFRNE